MPSITPSWNSPFLESCNEFLVCTTKTFLHPCLKQPSNVVECLRKLHASNGSRNALKMLGYNIVKLLKVDFLALVFNGDVVFELPPIKSFVGNSQAKWTFLDKTIT